jgi:cyclic beta-1,2-glucan synthetase
MGTGDWNDGMNRVGHEGRGESVWLGWFLIVVLRQWTTICEQRQDNNRAQHYRNEAQRLAGMLELAWDGNWYRRAYFDDGSPLGSAQNEECRIDSLTQSWAVFSQAADSKRTEKAMDAVRAQLVRRDAQVVLLLTPPFDRMAHDPGYIKGYLPGVRENGGLHRRRVVDGDGPRTSGAATRRGAVPAEPNQPHALAEGLDIRAEPYGTDVYAHRCTSVGAAGAGTGSAGWIRAAIGRCLDCKERRHVQHDAEYPPSARLLDRLEGQRHTRSWSPIPITAPRYSLTNSTAHQPIPTRCRW